MSPEGCKAEHARSGQGEIGLHAGRVDAGGPEHGLGTGCERGILGQGLHSFRQCGELCDQAMVFDHVEGVRSHRGVGVDQESGQMLPGVGPLPERGLRCGQGEAELPDRGSVVRQRDQQQLACFTA